MFKISSKVRSYILVPVISCALFLVACSQQSSAPLSGIWRSEDSLGGKNLVLEFVPDGTGSVFSGSIIGLPADAPFEWEKKGDEIRIETQTGDPATQTLTLLSEEKNTLVVEVNRSELTLIRVDSLIDGSEMESLP